MIVSIETATEEQRELLHEFTHMLNSVSKDGGKKRAAGLKKSWKVDQSHEAAIFSHLNKWKHGEKHDPDSGQHPLVHLAWRALAIAWQESDHPNVESDATGYKEDVVHTPSLRAHLARGCGMEYQKVGHEGVELSQNERATLWDEAHHPRDRRGRVFVHGEVK
jgi:Domain of unknown function (DUF5664)